MSESQSSSQNGSTPKKRRRNSKQLRTRSELLRSLDANEQQIKELGKRTNSKKAILLKHIKEKALRELEFLDKFEQSHGPAQKQKRVFSPENRDIDQDLIGQAVYFEDSFSERLLGFENLVDDSESEIEQLSEESDIVYRRAMADTHNFEVFGTELSVGDRAPIDLQSLYKANSKSLEALSIETMNAMINSGKALTEEIKKARGLDKTKIKFKNFLLNITSCNFTISRTELTKNRFMGILHKHMHGKYVIAESTSEAATFKGCLSPLIMGLVIEDTDEMHKCRHLLGSGYQYQWNEFMEDEKPVKIGAFVAGCYMMDYLSYAKKALKDDSSKVIMNFKEFLQTDECKNGDTSVAAMRNMGQTMVDTIKADRNIRTLMNQTLKQPRFDFSMKAAKKNNCELLALVDMNN